MDLKSPTFQLFERDLSLTINMQLTAFHKKH